MDARPPPYLWSRPAAPSLGAVADGRTHMRTGFAETARMRRKRGQDLRRQAIRAAERTASVTPPPS